MQRRRNLATALAFCLTLTGAVVVSAKLTDGFQAYTLESARRLQALRTPRDLSELPFVTMDGELTTLRRYAGSWLLVDFIYARCVTLCSSLGASFSNLQQRLSNDLAANRVRLLSVSIDPANDGPQQLAAYRARHSKQAQGWDMARPPLTDLPDWLDRFGVIVIADEMGGYAHNAAIHVVGPDGRLRAIFDAGDTDSALGFIAHAR